MSNMAGVLKEAGTAYPSRAPVFTAVFCGDCVADLFSFLCCVVILLCFGCLRPVFCVLNVASVSRLFIIDFPFGFL